MEQNIFTNNQKGRYFQRIAASLQGFIIQRVMGIEPTYPAWEAGVLPLNYTRIFYYYINCNTTLPKFARR